MKIKKEDIYFGVLGGVLVWCASLMLSKPEEFQRKESEYKTEVIRHYDVFGNIDGDYIKVCEGASIRMPNSVSFVTSAHCLKEGKNLYIQDQDNFKMLTNLVYLSKDQNLSGEDLAFFYGAFDYNKDCDKQPFYYAGKNGDICSIEENEGNYSLCAFDQGQSGKVLTDKSGNACFIYSGYYNINENGEDKRLGVYKKIGIKKLSLMKAN